MHATKPQRRYFDNAATSFPKPPGVSDAVRDYLENVGASAGRGAYREAVQSGHMLDACRDEIRRLFGCRAEDHVVFTLNGSDALNIAIKGLLRPGDHAVTTWMDHNSVLRPLHALSQRGGIEWTAVRVDPGTTLLNPDELVSAIRRNTRLVALNHASNVTGALQPLDRVAAICRERGIFLLLDAAQSAGHVPIDFAKTPIDLLATPGHKGLLGPLGTGVLVVRAGIDDHMQTVREGGTGSVSEQAVQPEFMPDKFEAGSHNAVGLAGLLASVRWLNELGVRKMRGHEVELMERMMSRLSRCDGLRWYGPRDAAQRVGVFSVGLEGLGPHEFSALLETQFGILTRSGLHCAPYAHRTLQTDRAGGTTRFSLGPFLTSEDVDAAGEALTAIARGVSQPA